MNYSSMKMRWKLAASFLMITLFFLAAVLFQGQKLGEVRNSMTQQKQEMEKRIIAAKINQFIQEMNTAESTLKQTSDVDIASQFDDLKNELHAEQAQLSFPAGTAAAEDLGQLIQRTKVYEDVFNEMINVLNDESIDPLAALEQIDDLHTRAAEENQNMLGITARLNEAAAQNAEQVQEHSFELLGQTSSVSLYALGIVVITTLIVAFLIIRSFNSSVSQLQKAVSAVAAGDLRMQIKSRSKDELGTLSRHFDDMVGKVRSMLGQTRSIAASMTDHSDSFRASATVTAKANEEIILSIGEISAGAEQQSLLSERSALLIGKLEKDLEEIRGTMDTVLSSRDTASSNTKSGLAAIGELHEAAKLSSESIDAMYKQLSVLSEQSTQISGITRSIMDISSQTQVLALNASIEAAQAGAHGRGFAVIAEQVRKLSTQTKESSTHIAGLIERLQEGMKSFQQSMQQTKHNLDEQDGQVMVTMTSFESIAQSMKGISGQIHLIHGQVEHTRQSKEELAGAVRSVAAIAEQTAAGVQTVNASSTQQHEAIRLIASQAEDIHELSQRLFGEISLFVLQDDDSNEIEDGGGDEEADISPQGDFNTTIRVQPQYSLSGQK